MLNLILEIIMEGSINGREPLQNELGTYLNLTRSQMM